MDSDQLFPRMKTRSNRIANSSRTAFFESRANVIYWAVGSNASKNCTGTPKME